jgi:hypothetical protein
MENIPNQEIVLSPGEESMYQHFVQKNPGITRTDFQELRGYALKTHNPGVIKFYEMNGLVMQEKPNPDDIKEMRPEKMG